MKKEVSNKKIIVCLIVSTIIVVSLLIISFYVFKKQQQKSVKVKTSTEIISITYSKEYNGLNMDKYVPLKDKAGKKLDKKEHYFDFTIKSNKKSDTNIDYDLVLEKDDKCSLEDNQIKVYLEQENEGTYNKVLDPVLFKSLQQKNKNGAPKGSMVMISDNIVDSINDKYRLRVWIDEKAKVKKPIKCRVSVLVYAKVK